jgi:hypothetical protein
MWRCSLCSHSNILEDNVFHCALCDSFQPRDPAPHPEFTDLSICSVFPLTGTKEFRNSYYNHHLKLQLVHTLPIEIINEISDYLSCVFEQGEFVDVCYAKVWYAAEIKEIKNQKALVQYQGWNQRWNEWIPLDSNRIQPYRAKSVGDTSAEKTKHLHIRRPPRKVWEMLIQHLVQRGYSFAEARHTLNSSREILDQTMHAIRSRFSNEGH